MNVAWTVAGSDSGGSAGLQADLRAFQALGVHGATVVTALTAQSPRQVLATEATPAAMIAAQLDALEALPPAAVKTGMIGSAAAVREIARHLRGRDVPLVVDPVMIAGSGARLIDGQTLDALTSELFPLATLVTPNVPEAEALVGRRLATPEAVEAAARELRTRGPREVLIKGGHTISDHAADFWTNGIETAWLVSPRRSGLRTHGTGCTLSAAIAAARARGHAPLDSLVLAKAYLNRGLRRAYRVAGDSPVVEGLPWPEGATPEDLPWLTPNAAEIARPFVFPGTEIGFYPIVDSVAWLERLLPLGPKTVQLRIKDRDRKPDVLESDVARAVALARRFGCRLFVNDHWEAALRHGAYGVHLGQEDLRSADVARLAAAGVRLGLSTHSYAELARAAALRPSYVALGPIFPTTAKPMRFGPQGIDGLALWRRLVAGPLVAIGGIPLERAEELRRAGADGIAVISDVTRASNVDERVQGWLRQW